MKLGPEHIGKKVRIKGHPVTDVRTVLAFDGYLVWARFPGGGHCTFDVDVDWELVEEPKRPSERIREIESNMNERPEMAHVYAIIQYLDEQWEKK